MALDKNTLSTIQSMLGLDSYVDGNPQEIPVIFERVCEAYLQFGKQIGVRRIQPQLLPLIAIVAELIEDTAKKINEQKQVEDIVKAAAEAHERAAEKVKAKRGRPKNGRKHTEPELVGSA